MRRTTGAVTPPSGAVTDNELAQLHRAELAIVKLRWFGIAGWLVILQRGDFPVSPVVVYAVFTFSLLYTALSHLQIRRARAIRFSAMATTLIDSGIVALICLVTRGIDSDLYPFFYLTVLATSIRFGVRETFVVLLLNSLLSLALFRVAPGSTAPPSELLLRLFYLVFAALLGGLLSHEAKRAFRLALVEKDRARDLLWRLIHAEEEGRKRVAGEIHDRMSGSLFELVHGIDRCRNQLLERDPASALRLARLGQEARACGDEIRALMNELRPSVLDDFGFSEALREFVASLQEAGELEVTLRVAGEAGAIRPEVNVALFRILQEAVLNVRKHAAARHVAIEFCRDDPGRLRLVVSDDGRGFDPVAVTARHFGLRTMKERAEACAGRLEVASRLGAGTAVTVIVPAA